MSQLKRIDSAGIALLIELAQWCRQRQVNYAYTNPSWIAQALMTLTHVTALLQVYPSIQAALNTFESQDDATHEAQRPVRSGNQ